MKSVARSPEKGNPPEPDPLRVLLSERESASACSLSLPSFRRQVQAGRIRRVKIPGLRRNLYALADLERFAASLEES